MTLLLALLSNSCSKLETQSEVPAGVQCNSSGPLPQSTARHDGCCADGPSAGGGSEPGLTVHSILQNMEACRNRLWVSQQLVGKTGRFGHVRLALGSQATVQLNCSCTSLHH